MSERDKTGKGPKTLFSMARNKDKAKRGGVIVDEPVDDPADQVEAEPAGDAVAELPDGDAVPELPDGDAVPELVDELGAGGELGDGDELVYFCGECGEELPSGAAFCGECGTPVALDDDDDADLGEYEAQELAAMNTETDSTRIPAYVAAGAAVAHSEVDAPWSADELDEEDPVADAAADEPVADEDVVVPTTDPVEAPAATLYGESTDFEPLAPPPPIAGWDLATPVIGTGGPEVDDETVPAAEAESGGDRDDDSRDEDAPTVLVPVAAVAGAAVGATLAAGATTAAADEIHPYDTLADARLKPAGVPGGGGTGTETGSKKGIWLAAAAVVVVLGLIAVIVIATTGSKSKDNEDVATATAESTTTTAAKESTSSSTAESTTTTTTEATTTTAAPTTAAPTTAVAPSNPGGSTGGSPGGGVTPSPPATPAYVSVSPGSGTICLPSRGSFVVTLVNEGGGNGQFQVRANGLSGSTSGSLSSGQGTSVTISDSSGGERTVSVQVVAAGSGTVSYTVLVGRAGC